MWNVLTRWQLISWLSATPKSIRGTCLLACSSTGFSAILLCCELWQAVKVHKWYRDPLQLYGQGFDFAEYTAFSNYTTDGPKIAVGLRDELYCKPDNEDSINFWNVCALVSFDACVSFIQYYNMDGTSWKRHVDCSRIVFSYFTCKKPYREGS